MPEVTLLYAGILGLMSFAIAVPAGRLRGSTGISIGDGGNEQMLLAMRRHSNFAESVPIVLILLGLLEMNGVPGSTIHVLGGVLVLARLAHAFGLRANSVSNPGRFIGAAGTALLTVVASVWAIVGYFT